MFRSSGRASRTRNRGNTRRARRSSRGSCAFAVGGCCTTAPPIPGWLLRLAGGSSQASGRLTKRIIMNDSTIANTLDTLFRELIDGVPRDLSYMLNTGDVGLVASLEKISAADAS